MIGPRTPSTAPKTGAQVYSFAILIAICLFGCQPDSKGSENTYTPPAPESGVNPDRLHQLKSLDQVTLKTPGGDLDLWVMDDASKRQEGMMFLQNNEVKDNEGMIFVFQELQKGDSDHGFWMHNTPLALDIAYIAKDGKVVNVGKGMPKNDTIVKPEGDYRYVIETKQGLAAKFGIEKGKTVTIPENLRTP